MSIILSSTGLSSEHCKKLFIDQNLPLDSRVYIAFDAAIDKDNKYILLAITQFKELGYYNVNISLISNIDYKNCDILYIAGGDTFNLMNNIVNSQLKDRLIQFTRERLVIGVSAGGIIFGQTLRTADIILEDEKTFNIDEGLKVLGFDILPHYSTKLILDNYKNPLLILTNEQAVIIRV